MKTSRSESQANNELAARIEGRPAPGVRVGRTFHTPAPVRQQRSKHAGVILGHLAALHAAARFFF
jgi:hypothetical protein